MCVVKTLGKKGVLTLNNRMKILGIDPKFGLSILSNKLILINFRIKMFLSV